MSARLDSVTSVQYNESVFIFVHSQPQAASGTGTTGSWNQPAMAAEWMKNEPADRGEHKKKWEKMNHRKKRTQKMHLHAFFRSTCTHHTHRHDTHTHTSQLPLSVRPYGELMGRGNTMSIHHGRPALQHQHPL